VASACVADLLLLLVVAGLMLGFVAFFLLPEVAHAVVG
jgi:hypothetical protein